MPANAGLKYLNPNEVILLHQEEPDIMKNILEESPTDEIDKYSVIEKQRLRGGCSCHQNASNACSICRHVYRLTSSKDWKKQQMTSNRYPVQQRGSGKCGATIPDHKSYIADPGSTACCQDPSVNRECFGGGMDCQRCGLKVYQAEMQIASGVPYHNICFSCHCCRKPLETLTYHENCGEIYCKQCYIRNFGPQGYGYSGVLQTPM